MVYNVETMSSAYLMSFALALTAALMQVVAVVCFGVAIHRSSVIAQDTAARPQRPVWPLFVFSLAAAALSLWHGLYVGLLFADWNYDFEVRSVEVLGIMVPLALGERVKNFVDSAFFLLLNAVGVLSLIVLLFRPRWRANASTPTWASRLLLLAIIALLTWSLSFTWGYHIENLRAFFQ